MHLQLPQFKKKKRKIYIHEVKISSITWGRLNATGSEGSNRTWSASAGMCMGSGVTLHPSLDPSVPSSQPSDVCCTDALALWCSGHSSVRTFSSVLVLYLQPGPHPVTSPWLCYPCWAPVGLCPLEETTVCVKLWPSDPQFQVLCPAFAFFLAIKLHLTRSTSSQLQNLSVFAGK